MVSTAADWTWKRERKIDKWRYLRKQKGEKSEQNKEEKREI
jgi:hypothetical protein